MREEILELLEEIGEAVDKKDYELLEALYLELRLLLLPIKL